MLIKKSMGELANFVAYEIMTFFTTKTRMTSTYIL